RWSHARSDLRSILQEQLDGIKTAGTWKAERIITSKQDVSITVHGSNNKILNFCANNYLGLSSHPAVVEAGKQALDKYGAGLSSVRFICGTQDIHKDLEQQISKFHGREDTILYASCFDANAGVFEALLGPEDAVLSDELNHASIIDGIRLCKAQKYRYKHRDLADLETHLKSASGARMKLIVTDGVFSMDGNVAPLRDLCDLADKYNALTFIDECHATGFFGETGRGTEEFFGINGRVDIINSTLGKALGGAAGGYTTGPKELVDLLRQSSDLCKKVAAGTKRFRSAMTKAGFIIAGEQHPICPVMLGDAKLASQFADKMLGEGIYVVGFSFPVVPRGKARIRVQISAAHTDSDIDRAVEAFIRIGRELGVVS
ncbi:hypothetical protein B566_EDAN016574, partial [Ephemera danica]